MSVPDHSVKKKKVCCLNCRSIGRGGGVEGEQSDNFCKDKKTRTKI